MADLNALIAQGAQFAAPPDPFAQYGKMQQLQQGETANQLNRMKMEEMQAANTERNALRQLDPTSPDYESQLFKVNPTMGIAYRKEASAAAASKATQEAQKALALKTSLDNHRSFLVGVNDQPSYDAWRTLTTKNIPELEKILPPIFSPEAKDGLLKTADDISKRLTVAPVAPPASVAEFNFAKTPEGGGFRGSYQDFVTAKAVSVRAPATPSAPVAVIGPDGTPILVTREKSLGMTPANMGEKPMTQAQKVKYTKDKVSDKNVVTGAFAVTGELEKLTDELVGNPDKKIAPAPGLSSITGFSALTNPLALPSGDARKALQKLETFKGKIMALGRQLASQEGKLGNMAVQEWKFVSDAVQKIDPAAGNLDEQMRDVVRQAREYAQRQQSKYDDTYADDLTTQEGNTLPAVPAVNIPQLTDPKQPNGKPLTSDQLKEYADKYFKGDVNAGIQYLRKNGWVEKPAAGGPKVVDFGSLK